MSLRAGNPGMPPQNFRMTPEQFEEKRRGEIDRDRKGRRLSIAGRIYAAEIASAIRPVSRDGLRQLAVGALLAADVLIEEAGE